MVISFEIAGIREPSLLAIEIEIEIPERAAALLGPPVHKVLERDALVFNINVGFEVPGSIEYWIGIS